MEDMDKQHLSRIENIVVNLKEKQDMIFESALLSLAYQRQRLVSEKMSSILAWMSMLIGTTGIGIAIKALAKVYPDDASLAVISIISVFVIILIVAIIWQWFVARKEIKEARAALEDINHIMKLSKVESKDNS